MNSVIAVSNLRKRFAAKGGPVEAVAGIDLKVGHEEIFGFLGPNGAGKTTTLRVLTTLLPIDGGQASVAGFDVGRQPQEVRSRIGYLSQLGGADELATGRESILLQGRLYGAAKADVMRRVEDLLGLLDLEDFADRRVRTYSGGQRRRLDVALGIVHEPRGAVPRRAQRRSGPAEPGEPLGAHPGTPGPGHDGLPHHALPGGGRCALRPDRHH